MEKEINSDYLRGHIDTIILKTLASGEKYGYEICKDIETKSNGSFVLKQPSLYSALKRLEATGLINSYWQDSKIGGKRHYYTLTDKGIEKYEESKKDWVHNFNVLDSLINDDKSDNEVKLDNEKLNEDIADSKNKIEEVKSFYEQYTSPSSIENNSNFLRYDFFNQELDALQNSTAELTGKKNSETTSTTDNINNDEQNLTSEKPENITVEEKSADKNKDYSNKNDAVFINETYMPDEKDPSFMNNMYLKIKAPVKESGGAVNYIASDAIQSIDFYGIAKKEDNKSKTKFKEIKPLENYEVKPYSRYNSSISKTEFIKYNKIKLYQYLLLFALMLIEISLCYYSLKPLNIFTGLTNKLFITSIAISLIFPIVAISLFMFNPYKKKIVNSKGKYIYKIILFCCALLLIYAINLLSGVNDFLDAKYLTYWLLPTILSTNIIISELLFIILKKSKIFKA